MSDCKFCEAMERNHRTDELWQQSKEDIEKYGKHMNSYSVAIVNHHWYKKFGKRSAGRTTDYRNQGLGYQLNYCPECGRKL